MQDKRNTESVVQEIMGLVEDIIGCDSSSYQFDCKREIQSKLRELVREPLSHKEAFELIAECEQDGPIYILRNTERAHYIINTNKE